MTAVESTGDGGPKSALRRKPRQARALQRVERVLDAAEEVFVEVGYDSASTNHIVTRAGTSIGSLYEFFPNKQAIAAALAQRYIERLRKFYDTWLIDDPQRSGEQLIDAMVDAMARFWRQHPGVVPLLRGALGAPELVDAGEQLRVAFVDHLEAVLASRRPDVSAKRTRQVAEVDFDITRALLERAQAEPQHKRATVLRELKTVLLAYQRAALGRASDDQA